MAPHKLPPPADRLSARLTREFSARAEFEQKADDMFAKLFGALRYFPWRPAGRSREALGYPDHGERREAAD